jgi:DNA replication licensing factor MCM4
LKARTSLLVAANPIKSKYDVNKSVIENINLPPALISRFDLIYILLDLPDKVQDLKIANHILSLYSSPNRYMDKTIMPHD